jgi:hypothetical protein
LVADVGDLFWGEAEPGGDVNTGHGRGSLDANVFVLLDKQPPAGPRGRLGTCARGDHCRRRPLIEQLAVYGRHHAPGYAGAIYSS